MRKRKVAHIIPAHNSVISTVKYQPRHGNYLATSSYDSKIRLWSIKNWSVMKTLSGHEDKISGLDISPVEPVSVKMEVEGDDDGYSWTGYKAPEQLVTSSFDKNWNVWAPDVLSAI